MAGRYECANIEQYSEEEIMYYTIRWDETAVSMLDQRMLPVQEVYRHYTNYHDVADAIRSMVVRGAPAIGIAAAMGIALAAVKSKINSINDFKSEMLQVCQMFASTRPTAVNLFWAINRMRNIIEKAEEIDTCKNNLVIEARKIHEEDIETNKKIGEHGHKYIEDGFTVMTYCNAGALATGGYGTALGVIRSAVEHGKKIKVYACETRPYLQGARITAWELIKDGIDTTLICDNMAGHFMKKSEIQCVIVGADRIAANGDTANKIGTYTMSVLAKNHGIPFYVAAPISTLDPDTSDGNGIVIEERSIDEVAYIQGVQIAPEGIFIKNPAFDVTPASNITAIITEKGVIENPALTGIAPLVSM